MNSNLKSKAWRQVAFALVATGSLLLGGCLEQVVVWAPDGQRAAVMIDHGLRLCSTDGKLTEVLVPDVYALAWLSDSQQLIVARERKVSEWTELARILGSERATALAAKAEAIWQQTVARARTAEWILELGGDGDGKQIMVYLWARHADGLRAEYGAKADEIRAAEVVAVHEVQMARIVGEKIQLGTTLHEGFEAIKDIRIAPRDRAAALVLKAPGGKDDDFRLALARVNGTGITPVAVHVASFPDWTPDGRSLVYVQAAGPETKDDLRLGTLVQREVLDAKGVIAVSEDPKYLAGWIFSANSRVRCLRDGRILFNAAEISLPIAADDYGEEREQLFALDPVRQATLVRLIPRKQEERLPKPLAFFEVSPDEKQIVFGWVEGQVSCLTLATGEVEEIQGKLGSKDNIQGAPVWRKDGTLTYTRRMEVVDGKVPARAVEIVVRQMQETPPASHSADEMVDALTTTGTKRSPKGTEQVLSASWSDQLVNSLFSKDK
jgi:hypothetical protein